MVIRKPPANKLPTKKRAAVKRMFERGVSVAGIAEAHGVDRKTVYTWAKAGGWTRPQDKAQGGSGSGPDGDGGDGGDHLRAVVVADDIDIDQILAETIMDLRSAMTASQKNYDYRPLSNLAMAIVKCLEVWAARHPVTPAALAKLALEMNTTPEEFQYALAEQWRLINNGND